MRNLEHVNQRDYLSKVPVVIVSAGHGDVLFDKYTTNGKQSPEWPDGTKIYEGQSVKDSAYRLVENLRAIDIPAQILNPELYDVDLHIKSSRENDLYDRYGGKTLGIELHHNAQPTEDADYTDKEGIKGFTKGGASGTEIWTSPGETPADPFAGYIIDRISKSEYEMYFGDYRYHNKIKNEKDKEAYFHMLTRTKSSMLIFEWMFMTSYYDCQVIKSMRDKAMIILAHAIADYIKEEFVNNSNN